MATTILRGLAPVRAVLDNGAVVLAKQSAATPAVTVLAAVEAGTVFDPPESPGLAHFVSRTIDRGTQTRTSDEIADQLEWRGVSLVTGVSRHTMQFGLTCLVEDLTPMLSLLADVMQRPTFPEEEVGTRRGEIVTLIRQDEDNPAAVAGENVLAELYGAEHPYGRAVRGTVPTVERITRADLAAFHAARMTPSSLTVVMVGDVEPSRAIDAARTAFGGWQGERTRPAALPDVAPRVGRTVRSTPMMSKSQAEIAYGFIAIRRADPQYYAYWVMNNVLGQYSLGGRLGDSIRERQGMAYHVFSTLDAGVIPGTLLVRAGVAAENVDRAIASIDAELEALAETGPTSDELAESRQYLVGSLPRHLETNPGIAAFLQQAEFFGLGLDYDLRIPDLLGTVTLEQVRAAARATLDPARATIVVAGPYAGPLR